MGNANFTRTLLSDATATGSAVSWQGWRGTWWIRGTWSAATAKLQWRPFGGSTWIDLDGENLSATADKIVNFEVAPGELRVEITGSPTAMYSGVAGTDYT